MVSKKQLLVSAHTKATLYALNGKKLDLNYEFSENKSGINNSWINHFRTQALRTRRTALLAQVQTTKSERHYWEDQYQKALKDPNSIEGIDAKMEEHHGKDLSLENQEI